VLQCVAVRCSALQCVAVCCSVLQCLAVCLHHYYRIRLLIINPMGWIRLVGSLKLYVSFPEYSLFYRAFLRKRPIILIRLLIINPIDFLMSRCSNVLKTIFFGKCELFIKHANEYVSPKDWLCNLPALRFCVYVCVCTCVCACVYAHT